MNEELMCFIKQNKTNQPTKQKKPANNSNYQKKTKQKPAKQGSPQSVRCVV